MNSSSRSRRRGGGGGWQTGLEKKVLCLLPFLARFVQCSLHLLPFQLRFPTTWLFVAPVWTFCLLTQIILRPLGIFHLHKPKTLDHMSTLDSSSEMPVSWDISLVFFGGLFFFCSLPFVKSTIGNVFPWLCFFLGRLSPVLSFLRSTFHTFHESQPVAPPLSKYFPDISCHLCSDDRPTFLILAVRYLFYVFDSY